jgi:DNA modification methylase
METNIIYCGDCLVKLKELPDESVDLIYIDPPFSSNRNYVAFWNEQEKRHFEDRFENVRTYIDYMKPRVEQLYRVLKPTGSFYYHCDYHAAHYIKVMLDRDDLFGYNNFRNEIIWHYRRWTGRAKKFQRLHDTILFYTKSDDYTFNEILIPYTEGSVERKLGGVLHRFKDDEEPFLVSNKSLQSKGVPANDVFIIPFVAPSAKERLGYPTQKPLALLDRIIKASSNGGDIVLDAFCGCGTALVAAQRQREKRKWIGIDISPTACRVMAKRLKDECGVKEGIDFWIRDLPKAVEELRAYPAFEFQNWAVNAIGGIPSRTKVRDKGIDGKLYPIEDIKKERGKGVDLFGDIDRYIPVQVKRTDQVGSPDIEKFETAMKRDKRDKGIFVGFSFSRDAEAEIRRAERDEGLEIEPITVIQIIEQQLDKQLK